MYVHIDIVASVTIFFRILFYYLDVVSKEKVERKTREAVWVEGEDGVVRKYVLNEPFKRPTPKPKPLKLYEIMASKMPECHVDMHSLTVCEIKALQQKVKYDFKIQKMQKDLKSLPVLKICEFVRFALSIEPNLSFIDGEIDFKSVSDDRLHLMEQYMLPNGNIESDDLDDESILVNVNADGVQNDTSKSVAANYQLAKIGGKRSIFTKQDLIRDGSGVLVEFGSDGELAIRFPAIDGKRSTFVISKEVWLNCLANGLAGQYSSRNDIVDVQSLVEAFAANWFQDQNTQMNMQIIPLGTDSSVIAETARITDADGMLANMFATDWFFGAERSISIAIDSAEIDDQDSTNDEIMASVSSISYFLFRTECESKFILLSSSSYIFQVDDNIDSDDSDTDWCKMSSTDKDKHLYALYHKE